MWQEKKIVLLNMEFEWSSGLIYSIGIENIRQKLLLIIIWASEIIHFWRKCKINLWRNTVIIFSGIQKNRPITDNSYDYETYYETLTKFFFLILRWILQEVFVIETICWEPTYISIAVLLSGEYINDVLSFTALLAYATMWIEWGKSNSKNYF